MAGYPEAHPEVITDDAEEMEKAYQADLQYLKKKVLVNRLCHPASVTSCMGAALSALLRAHEHLSMSVYPCTLMAFSNNLQSILYIEPTSAIILALATPSMIC